MKCESCNKNEATVHLTDLINGEELHMCDKCAEKEGSVMPTISVNSVLSNLIEQHGRENSAETDNQACATCGMTYAQVRKQGKVGCARCYEVFAKGIVPFVERIQGSSEHRGKAPRRLDSTSANALREMHKLKERLKIAVTEENYELAATIRDEIRNLDASE